MYATTLALIRLASDSALVDEEHHLGLSASEFLASLGRNLLNQKICGGPTAVRNTSCHKDAQLSLTHTLR